MNPTQAAISFTKDQFLKNKNITDELELKKCFEIAENAEEIIRKNIVQGIKKDDNETFS